VEGMIGGLVERDFRGPVATGVAAARIVCSHLHGASECV
jgi:hypothetical protein